MKKIFLFLLVLFSIISCVRKSKYIDSMNIIDSLIIENTMLTQQSLELLNGEERLKNQINYLVDKGDFLGADEKLKDYLLYHPESPELRLNSVFYSEITNKAQILRDSIQKVIDDSLRIANINELGAWKIGRFVNEFEEPTGEHYVYCTCIGEFSNSATSSSELLISIVVKSFSDSTYIFEIEFDEYIDGTIDNRYYDSGYGKVVNKQDRIIYTKANKWLGWQMIEGDEYLSIDELLFKEAIYDFTLHFEYKTVYDFKIDTKYLHNALIKAGLMKV